LLVAQAGATAPKPNMIVEAATPVASVFLVSIDVPLMSALVVDR
jgi:hypothetical protein